MRSRREIDQMLQGEFSSGGLGQAMVRRRVRVPIGSGEADFFTFHGLVDGREHLALGLGPWTGGATPLVRIHSECLTGDVFASGKCDCGEQLQEAITAITKVGGILLYLRQEGRGIGLYNKLDAYSLQAQGLDTYEANRRLGLGDDLRDYTVARQMLDALGVERVRLLTNNPDKVAQLEKLGIQVEEQVSTGVFLKPANRHYLEAKVAVTKHRLRIPKVAEQLAAVPAHA